MILAEDTTNPTFYAYFRAYGSVIQSIKVFVVTPAMESYMLGYLRIF